VYRIDKKLFHKYTITLYGGYMQLGLKTGTVKLYDHQVEWEENAHETMAYIKKIIGNIIIDIQHIGSTAIKTIKAKPIIDIAVGIIEFESLSNYIDILGNEGIIYLPNHPVPENKLFVMGNFERKVLTHHIHFVKYNGEQWNNYVNLRDYLNGNLEEAKEYERLKIELREGNKENREKYTRSKEEYIKQS
jgi:GrpB-like predicted nucleotidyltransferase (UPF0157 family)